MRTLGLASLLFSLSAFAAGPTYRVTELQALTAHPGGVTEPTGISADGDAVGSSYSAGDNDARAVIWPKSANGVPTALTTAKSVASSMADDGSVAGGELILDDRNVAALYIGGGTTVLPDPNPPLSPGDPFTWIEAVIDGSSAAGQIQYLNGGGFYGLWWHAGTISTLPTLGHPTAGVVDANASGAICGTVFLPPQLRPRGVVWENGTIARVLDPLPGRLDSRAEAINAHGDVTGTSFLFGVVWPAGSTTPYALPLPPDASSAFANDINNHRWVAGAVNVRGRGRAVLWTDPQTVIDLNATIPPGTGWDLQRANEINDDGVIVGEGRFNGRFTGFRLDPVKATPIVIVPGLLSTELLVQTPSGDVPIWVSPGPYDMLALDGSGQNTAPIAVGPILESGFPGTYGDLLAFLESSGYERDVTLFTFPYDWRMHNGNHALLLEAYIQTHVLPPSGADSVIVIAHSMGGLITRQLALNRPDLVEKAIYIGTPHAGSAEAFTALGFDDDFARAFIGVLARLAPVAATFPSLYQLLPRAPFVLSLDQQRTLTLAETYTPSFLQDVHWIPLADQFHTVIAAPATVPQHQIAGSALPTLDSLVTFIGIDGERKWFPVIDNGDGTVTRTSAAAAPGAPQPSFVGGVQHADLASDPCVQDLILRIIRDQAPPACASAQPSPLAPGYSWSTASPVNVTVTPDSPFWTLEHNEAGFVTLGTEYQFEIDAFATGVFSLTFRDQQQTIVEYAGIPVATGSHATLTLHADGTTSDMELDGISIGSGPVQPQTALALLARAIERLPIQNGLRSSLLAKVDAAARALARGQSHTAENILNALLNEIDAQSGKGLTPSDATGLRAAVTAILRSL